MSTSALTRLKVGFTTLIALVIVFGGVLWVKDYNPAKKKVRITVEFIDGNGIAPGDPVEISGIKVGEVTKISLDNNKKALVSFYMNYLKLAPDCSFTVKDVGLMGDKVLVITPGDGNGELDPEIIHKGTESTGIGSLMADAGIILKKLDSISEKINNDLDISKLSNDFGQTLHKFQNAIKIYEELALQNKEPITKSIKNLEVTTTEMKNFMVSNENKMEKAIESFQQTSDKISSFIGDMQNLSTVVDTIAAYMDSGEGTVARLIKYDDLYEELRRTNANIDSFITDFQRNPGKYTKDMEFKLRLF